MKEKIKKILYDWTSNEGYGNGGYWKFKKQKFINIIIFVLLFINFLLIIKK